MVHVEALEHELEVVFFTCEADLFLIGVQKRHTLVSDLPLLAACFNVKFVWHTGTGEWLFYIS